MEAKPWYKSVTIVSALASLLGMFDVIMQDPTVLKPLVDLGLFGAPNAALMAKIMAGVGALGAIFGRVRSGGGKPLSM